MTACNSATQVIIHTADADSDANARWFYEGIKAQGVTWDITGLSYYCFWHGPLSNLSSVITDVRSRYGKPVVIAETASDGWSRACGPGRQGLNATLTDGDRGNQPTSATCSTPSSYR